MKPEDQRIALAKWDGFTSVTRDANPYAPITGILYGSGSHDSKSIPNYLSDLNALRPLLLKLSPVQQQMFACYVSDFADSPEAKTRYDEDDYFGYIEVPADFAFKMFILSPELICKALLKTLKLWA